MEGQTMPDDRIKLKMRADGGGRDPGADATSEAPSETGDVTASSTGSQGLTDAELRALGGVLGTPGSPEAGARQRQLDIEDLPQVTNALDALLKVLERLENFAERHPDVFRDGPPARDAWHDVRWDDLPPPLH